MLAMAQSEFARIVRNRTVLITSLIVSLHISLGIVVVANWVAITGTEILTWLTRLLSGTAAAELIVDVWGRGISPGDSLLVLVPVLVWVVVAIALTSSLFRWEARP